MLFDGVGDEQRLVFGVVAGEDPQLFARGGLRPQLLSLARLVVLHHRAGRPQDVLSRPVVLLQPDGLGLRKIALEIQNIADVRSPPAIDRLVLVAHHADVAVAFREQPHQVVLGAVGVLVFVDHHVAQPPVPGLAGALVVLQQAHRFEQQIVEIQGIGRAQRLFVFFKYRGQRFALFVDRSFEQIGRPLLGVLRAADLGKCRAILHELFFVEPQPPVRRFDHAELVLVVINAEAPRESRPDARQRFAICPQHPHAKRVERGDVGRRIQIGVGQQR